MNSESGAKPIVTRAGQQMLQLPWPPTVNHYWWAVRGKVIVSPLGKRYRANVLAACVTAKIPIVKQHGRIAVEISAFPPDKRKRDLDNVLKALLDAMQHGGVYVDDSQIDRLVIQRCSPVKDGMVVVCVTPLSDEADCC